MKKILLLLLTVLFLSPPAVWAQSKTIEALRTKFDDAFSMYFYKNTLRMMNQTENKEFDDMIKNIEKMRFMIIDKTPTTFDLAAYRKLIGDYKSESYEEVMTSRFEGKKFDVLLKDKKGSTMGTVLLVNDSSKLYVLDILGTIDIHQASKIFLFHERELGYWRESEILF